MELFCSTETAARVGCCSKPKKIESYMRGLTLRAKESHNGSNDSLLSTTAAIFSGSDQGYEPKVLLAFSSTPAMGVMK